MKELFSVVSISILLIACNKGPKERTTRIEKVYEITHDAAKVETFSEVLKREYLDGGVCWGLEPNPILTDNKDMGSNINTGEDYYELDNLIAGTEYFVRSYLFTENDIQYSEAVSFKTEELPEPPCTTTPGIVDFEDFIQEMSDLEYVGDYLFESTCEYGKLSFYFRIYPVSGIYYTQYFNNLDEDDHIGIDFNGGPFNSYFNTGENREVYVVVKNDKITIRFCDLQIVTGSGIGPQSHVLTGELHYH